MPFEKNSRKRYIIASVAIVEQIYVTTKWTIKWVCKYIIAKIYKFIVNRDLNIIIFGSEVKWAEHHELKGN
jgi:hypothetical protein